VSLTQYEQTGFDLGELSPDYVWRADLKVRNRSLKSALNCRPRYSGALEARPGTEHLFFAAGDGWLASMSIEGIGYFIVITATAAEVRLQSDRSQVASLTSCPWTADMLPDLVIETYGKRAYICHQEMNPQILEQQDDGTWTRTAWAPADGTGGTKRQPFYRYADRGVTLTPSALTGSITVEASAAVFDADHVGLRFRLQGREIEIDTVTDGDTATATVIQDLHKTVQLTVESTDGFSLGESIAGADTAARAEVVSIDSSTVMTVLKKDFTQFFWLNNTGVDGRELVIGPNAKSRLTAAEAVVTPQAPVVEWTEQAMSDYRGWPATVTVHSGRLWFARLPDVPFGVMASEINDPEGFEVGVGDSDAIFEEMGNARIGAIRWLVPSEQLLILTSDKTFYIPESETNPIRPTSIGFIEVGPDGANLCKPVVLSEGVVFVEEAGAELIGAFPTGDVRRSWRTASLSYMAPHLIAEPRAMAFVSASTQTPERQVYIANADGGASVLTYSETDAEALPSLVPWTTTGDYRSFAASQGECWALVAREIDGTTKYSVEAFDTARTLDCAFDLDASDLQGDATTEVIDSPSGAVAAEKVYRCASLADTTCSLVVDGTYVGEVDLDGDGDFGAPAGGTALQLGFKFGLECVPWHPMDAQDQTAVRRKKRIGRVHVRWAGRYLSVDDTLQPVYRANEDMNLAPPLRDETTRVPTFGGWADEPTVTIGHAYPGPFTLYGVSMEVAG